MKFDSIFVVDWSAGNDTGPRPRRDAIWLGGWVDGAPRDAEYLRNRTIAFDRLCAVIETECTAGRTALFGFDFPFAYPAGFARAVIGRDDPLSLWDFMAEELFDTPRRNSRFELAARLNGLFSGIGPFWFNGTKADIPGLPRLKSERTGDCGLPERRACEMRAKGTFTCWQMGGAGAVGGQVMTGMAVLSRLRARYPDLISVWPVEKCRKPVVFAEVWPSLIAAPVRAATDAIKDRAQVTLLARALAGQSPRDLAAMLSVDTPVEGWILGLGHEDKLEAALCPV